MPIYESELVNKIFGVYMATYKEIQEHIKAQNGFTVKTCWIAHVKEINGLIDKNYDRQNPCPNDKIKTIEQALRSLGEI